jgi:hypothetical protein
VDFNAREKSAQLTDNAGKQFEFHFLMEKVRDTVPRQSVYACVREPNLKTVSCGGIVQLCRPNVRS